MFYALVRVTITTGTVRTSYLPNIFRPPCLPPVNKRKVYRVSPFSSVPPFNLPARSVIVRAYVCDLSMTERERGGGGDQAVLPDFGKSKRHP